MGSVAKRRSSRLKNKSKLMLDVEGCKEEIGICKEDKNHSGLEDGKAKTIWQVAEGVE